MRRCWPPPVARIKGLLGRAPRAVTADRGYGEAAVQDALTELGVTTVVIPRKGKPARARREVEHGRGFRRLVKWRTGSEGRISYLKHRYGWDRTRLDGLDGAGTWCGLGVLAHNAVKIGALQSAAAAAVTVTTMSTRPLTAATGPASHRSATNQPATGSRAGPRRPGPRTR